MSRSHSVLQVVLALFAFAACGGGGSDDALQQVDGSGGVGLEDSAGDAPDGADVLDAGPDTTDADAGTDADAADAPDTSDADAPEPGDVDAPDTGETDADVAPPCDALHLTVHGDPALLDPAGVRVLFSAERCDGHPATGLAEHGTFVVRDGETGKTFVEAGADAPVVARTDEHRFHTVVALDLSNTVVQGGHLDPVLDAAAGVVDRLVADAPSWAERHAVALYVFGSTGASELWQPFTRDPALLHARIEALRETTGHGSTNLYGAVQEAITLLAAEAATDPLVRPSLLLFADSLHETGDAAEQEAAALGALEEAGVTSYVAALAGDYDAQELAALATFETTFGVAGSDADLPALFGGLADEAVERARAHYVLAACSPLEGPGRELVLEASQGALAGSVTVTYDATGFVLAGCESEAVLDPCGDAACGEVEGVSCGVCEVGGVCVEGACCTPSCAAEGACGPDGCGGTCGGCVAEETCAGDAGAAVCEPWICTPGVLGCDAGAVQQCADDGLEWLLVDDCPSAGAACVEAACEPVICPAEQVFCFQGGLFQCDETGTQQAALEPCEDGDPCTLDTCAEGACVFEPGGDQACDDGDPCTVVDHCDGAGGCEGEPKDCSSMDDACHEGACVDGTCLPQVLEGATCDDGDGCTVSDACGADGACAGTYDGALPGCPCAEDDDCDDGLACTQDRCDDGTCHHEVTAGHCLVDGVCRSAGERPVEDLCLRCDPEADARAWTAVTCDDANACTADSCEPEAGCVQETLAGAKCDDGVPCTVLDRCDEGGVCAGLPKDCSSYGDACHEGVCVEGTCLGQVLEGVACDDGDPCTLADACAGDGACTGEYDGALPDCACVEATDCDDTLDCTVDWCDLGTCHHDVLADHCLVDGTCRAAGEGPGGDVCRRCAPATDARSWTPVDCDDDNPCTVDSCDPASGCIHAPEPGEACDDGDPCTLGDLCSAGGVCTGDALDCSAQADACNLATCEEGACVVTPDVGAPCDDGDACTLGDTCSGEGACAGTWDVEGCGCLSAADCDDDNACTDDACVEGVCANEPLEGTACDDGDACSQDDHCEAGACVGTCECEVDAQCSEEAAPCRRWACEAGACVLVPDPTTDHVSCDDGDACTAGDLCLHGVCEGDPLECSGEPVGTCEEAVCVDGACQATVDEGAPCDDGDACTLHTVCDGAGACAVGFTVPTCACATDADCTDGLYCNGVERCVSGTCQPGQPPTDGIDCTEDACDEATDQMDYKPDDASCANDWFCDGAEQCDVSVGGCVTVPVDLDDGVPCTTDLCDEDKDQAVHVNACDDGVYCNGVERCDAAAGTCELLYVPETDDGLACTTDTCDETFGVVNHEVAEQAPTDPCADDFCGGATCEQAYGLGCLGEYDEAVLVQGEATEGGDWYVFTAVDSLDASGCDPFFVQVRFVYDPTGSYRVSVYRDGCPGEGEALCGGGSELTWDAGECPCAVFPKDTTAEAGLCTDQSATFRVHVEAVGEPDHIYVLSVENRPM